MQLHLLRHAEAESFAPSDAARTLTAKGTEQARRVGRYCGKHGLVPQVILTSPVTRALQTAKLVAGQLDGVELTEVPWAACGMDPLEALAEIKAYAEFDSVMLVGHQPDLGLLAASLLGLPRAAALRVRKALLVGIELEGNCSAGAGVLQFFLPVQLM
ncbi:MAG: phosphohistidine phosphatase SixA [Chthoniobacterales bacterium]|nr:phosphohistidine phosphatase SixA [Chthoniobacterales bacterium]